MSAISLLGLVAVASAAPVSFRELLARPRAAPTKIVVYGEGPQQFAELWLPAGRGPHPTVVMIHGGCWLAQLPGAEMMALIAEDLRSHGYAVWNIEYRRIGHTGGGYPGTFLDAGAAIDMLSGIAPANNLDLGKVIAIGHSAGGHLAAWSAGRPRIPASSPLHAATPLPIAGVVSLAGINDLERYRAKGPSACGGPPTIDALVGASARAGGDLYADTSPAALLPLHVKQIVFSAALDKIVPAEFGHAYAKAASAKGDVVQERTFDAAGHFELIDPQSGAWLQIRAEIDAMMKVR